MNSFLHSTWFPGGGFPAFGQAKPVVTPFGQAMAAPMASSNPFLVRLVSFFLSLLFLSTCVFLILPLTFIPLCCRVPLRLHSIQQGAPPPTPSYSTPSNRLLRDKLALLHVLIRLISPSSFKEKRLQMESETLTRWAEPLWDL